MTRNNCTMWLNRIHCIHADATERCRCIGFDDTFLMSCILSMFPDSFARSHTMNFGILFIWIFLIRHHFIYSESAYVLRRGVRNFSNAISFRLGWMSFVMMLGALVKSGGYVSLIRIYAAESKLDKFGSHTHMIFPMQSIPLMKRANYKRSLIHSND